MQRQYKHLVAAFLEGVLCRLVLAYLVRSLVLILLI